MCAALLGLMLVCSTMIFSPARRGLFGFAAQQRRAQRAAIEPDVDVPVAGHFHGRHAFDGPDLGHQFRGDLPGRLAQLFGQLKRSRHGHFAEIALPRLLDGYRQIEAVAHLYVCVKGAGNVLFDGMEHGNYEYSVMGSGAGGRGSGAGGGSARGRGRRGELGSFRRGAKWFHLFRFPPNWVRLVILHGGL